MHDTGNPPGRWPMHAWLQAMQARISSARPSAALVANSGSAMKARAMAITSASPSVSARSASWGWLMRPQARTGTDTASRIARAAGSAAPVGVNMVGTMWLAPARVCVPPVVTLT